MRTRPRPHQVEERSSDERAEYVLGVSLETWLGYHQDGGRVLEDCAAVRYEALRMMWEDVVPGL
ncbi:hypothetical protein C491_17182 [Natronococcus amylolyticus DSM 10524]|uniref:Uncharacterized protein n=1 Tax=Natronococcus amylolyticus DSM 10524 TaxID=1227497 RepID=L9X4F2_9EURY|nr:hypothetical protein [Natronococcus amylolyticus]ELY55468.1 hypothetical protein C491_17182 [Natronococcus amylolyticus DSM 10524]